MGGHLKCPPIGNNSPDAVTLFIEPGSPWENGYVESFIGKLRDELLNREIIYTLKEASILIEQWRRHYNGVRPHSALGYRPPTPETIAFPGMGMPSPWSFAENQGGVTLRYRWTNHGGPVTPVQSPTIPTIYFRTEQIENSGAVYSFIPPW